MSYIGTNRRNFLASVTAGLGVAGGVAAVPAPKETIAHQSRLPREVWVASITLGDFEPETYQEHIELILKRMAEVAPYRPDIVCLPEVAPFMKLEKRPPLSDVRVADVLKEFDIESFRAQNELAVEMYKTRRIHP